MPERESTSTIAAGIAWVVGSEMRQLNQGGWDAIIPHFVDACRSARHSNITSTEDSTQMVTNLLPFGVDPF